MKHYAGLYAAVCMLILSCAPTQDEAAAEWGYRIGQPEVPPVVIQSTPETFKVYPGHPRLYFRDTDLPVLQRRIQGELQDEWKRLQRYVEETLTQPIARHAEVPKAWHRGRAVAFAAVLTGDRRFRDWAMQWADAMIAIGFPEGERDDNYRGRLMSLALIYDWLYPELTEEERTRLRESILAHIDRNWYFAESPSYIGGHSRWGVFTLEAGLLAVITEAPDQREKLMLIRKHWLEGYDPIQAWIGVDGGYHMGTAYGASYTWVRHHCVWSSATNEDVYYPYRENLPYFWIYANPYSREYPRIGDFYGWDYDHGTTVVAAGVMKNSHAAWWANLNQSDDTFYDILYGDKSVQPLPPDDQVQPLPLSRQFRNAGYVIMRDRWDDRSTLVYFKSTSFASENHHHRDQNSFTINYRGRLAIDAGNYQGWGAGYGSEHWHNYFTRTIAHNAITIFDPTESFGKSSHGPRSNDGGQLLLNPRTPEDIKPDGMASLDGITAYAEEGTYAFTTGDASKAYNPEKCKTAVRSFLYLRNPERWGHPIMFVYDRVTSSKPEFKKTWLLHSSEKPKVAGQRIEIAAGEGKLYTWTLLPRKARQELIGGPGKRFWVNGRNYPFPEQTEADAEKLNSDAGAWRVEVSPSVAARDDRFLHMMTVSDRNASEQPPQPVPVQADPAHGVSVDQYVVLFATDEGAMTSCRYDVANPGVRQHLFIGVGASQNYVLSHDGQTIGTATATDAGTVLFQPGEAATGSFTLTRQ